MRVFLSYSPADERFAKQLALELTQRGCDVWDPRAELFAGDNWAEQIGQALKQSKAMVVLLSPDSVNSDWVRREIEYALGDPNYAGRLFPVLVRPTEEVPWILRKLQILHAKDNPAEISKRIASALTREAYEA
jgi:hypothetical protein